MVRVPCQCPPQDLAVTVAGVSDYMVDQNATEPGQPLTTFPTIADVRKPNKVNKFLAKYHDWLVAQTKLNSFVMQAGWEMPASQQEFVNMALTTNKFKVDTVGFGTRMDPKNWKLSMDVDLSSMAPVPVPPPIPERGITERRTLGRGKGRSPVSLVLAFEN